MEQRLTPGFFYGSALAALIGLMSGVLFHVPWEKHPGGPRILFSAAEAAELVRPAVDDSPANVAAADQTETAAEDTSYLPPDPLPVTRLHPEMFDVQPAAADEAEREDIDDTVADAAPQAPPHDLD